MWCTLTKQGTSHTGLFWDMNCWSWQRGEKINSSVNLEIFVFMYLKCFLSPPCNFWLIFQTFFHKNSVFSAVCQIQNYWNRKLWRPVSQNQTSRETAYGLLHKLSYLKKQRSMKLDFGTKVKLNSFYQKCHSFQIWWLKGVLHPYPKINIFVLYLKIINTFFFINNVCIL